MPLILASASPRRAELLSAAGYGFETWVADIDEQALEGEGATDYVERLARGKCARALERWLDATGRHPVTPPAGPPSGAASEASQGVIVIGADTAVVVGGEILGKPRDHEDAARMLRRLSGRTHQVMTGVAVQSTTASVSMVEVTDVTFVSLSADEIAWYVASGEGQGKAGAYAIQGLAARFIPRIVGSYANVVGLPVAALDGLIRRLGAAPDVLASRG